jgi:hypothetical protein
VEEDVKASFEVWRIGFSDSTFTYYGKGTLYSTSSNLQVLAVFDVWEEIDLFGFVCVSFGGFCGWFG